MVDALNIDPAVQTQNLLDTGSIFDNGRVILDDIVRTQGHGSYRGVSTATMWGIDHENVSTYIESPHEEYGLVLFTKPMCNLSYNNILQDTRTALMASKNNLSMPRIIKAMLDPISQRDERFHCPIIDRYSAFIPLLTNTCTSISGAPSLYMNSFETPAGKYGEVYTMPDGHAEQFESWSATATFNNGPGDLVGEFFVKWVTYMGLLRDGTFRRRIGFTRDNRRDYDIRAYSIILDSTRRYIQKISCPGAMWPRGVDTGKDFDMVKNNEGTIIEDSKTVNITFQAMGYYTRDPIVFLMFNQTVMNMNPFMHPNFRRQYMVEIPDELRLYYNKVGYPWIDMNTSKLQWFMFKEDFTVTEKRRKASGLY